MTLSHAHLIHRHRLRRGSGKLMVSVVVAASRLVPWRERERDSIVTDPYER